MLRLGLLIAVCAMLQAAVYADVHMVVIGGQSMVRMDAFSTQFGAVSYYDGTMNCYCVSRNGRVVYFTPYCTSAWIGDSPVALDVAPVIVDGAVYVPMHFMCRAFGFGCTWRPADSQVVIFDGFTHQRVTWVTDIGWGARAHFWLHPATFRAALRFSASPRFSFHGGPVAQGHFRAPGGHGPSHAWNGGQMGGNGHGHDWGGGR